MADQFTRSPNAAGGPYISCILNIKPLQHFILCDNHMSLVTDPIVDLR
jgi:hypothetical protein